MSVYPWGGEGLPCTGPQLPPLPPSHLQSFSLDLCSSRGRLVFDWNTFSICLKVHNVHYKNVALKTLFLHLQVWQLAVVDPGFSWGGCANSQSGYYFAHFVPKTAWKWKNLDPGAKGRAAGTPLDAPMISRLVYDVTKHWVTLWQGGTFNNRPEKYPSVYKTHRLDSVRMTLIVLIYRSYCTYDT